MRYVIRWLECWSVYRAQWPYISIYICPTKFDYFWNFPKQYICPIWSQKVRNLEENPTKSAKFPPAAPRKNAVLHFPRSQCFQHAQKVFLSSSKPCDDLESVTKHGFLKNIPTFSQYICPLKTIIFENFQNSIYAQPYIWSLSPVSEFFGPSQNTQMFT